MSAWTLPTGARSRPLGDTPFHASMPARLHHLSCGRAGTASPVNMSKATCRYVTSGIHTMESLTSGALPPAATLPAWSPHCGVVAECLRASSCWVVPKRPTVCRMRPGSAHTPAAPAASRSAWPATRALGGLLRHVGGSTEPWDRRPRRPGPTRQHSADTSGHQKRCPQRQAQR